MERSCRSILILISISMHDLLFSSGEWIEINGCHLLPSSAIQNQTSLPANEPGVCLQWCGTNTVALQNTTCLCINAYGPMNRKIENLCSQDCSGNEKLTCGGNSPDIVSVYRERRDVSTTWGSLNGSGCLTYNNPVTEEGGKLVPDDCTMKHSFHCYSETTYGPNDCIRERNLDDLRTWYEALEACSSPFPLYLWPAPDANTCSAANIRKGIFWVAVYWWTKVIKTSTTSSTARTTSADTSTTSTTSSTITMPRSTASMTYITSSTLTTTETSSPSTNSTRLPPLSLSGTSSTTTATTSTTTPISSPSTSTSSPTSVSNNWTNITFTDSHSSFTSRNRSASIYITALTNASSISMTTSTYTSTKSAPTHEPPSSANSGKTASSETSSFRTDPPNIGLGIAIGILAGILISITIACGRRRFCNRESSRNMDQPSNRESSRNINQSSNIYVGLENLNERISDPASIKNEVSASKNMHSNGTGAHDNPTYDISTAF